jgi:hypothetical protein
MKQLKDIAPRTCSGAELTWARQKMAKDILALAEGTNHSVEWAAKIGDYLRSQGLPLLTLLAFGTTRLVFGLPFFLVLKFERPLHPRLVCPERDDILTQPSLWEALKHVGSGQAIEQNTANYSDEKNCALYPWLYAPTLGRFCAPFDSEHWSHWPNSGLIQTQMIPMKRVIAEVTALHGNGKFDSSTLGVSAKTGQLRLSDVASTLLDELEPVNFSQLVDEVNYLRSVGVMSDEAERTLKDIASSQSQQALPLPSLYDRAGTYRPRQRHTTAKKLREVAPHNCPIEELEAGRQALTESVLKIAQTAKSKADFDMALAQYLRDQKLPLCEIDGNGGYTLPFWLRVKVGANKPEVEQMAIECRNTYFHPWLMAECYGEHFRADSFGVLVQERLIPLEQVIRELKSIMGEKGGQFDDVGICPLTGRFMHADGARDRGEDIHPPDESFKNDAKPSFFDCIALSEPCNRSNG